MSNPNRNFGLDLVRAISIIFVLVNHHYKMSCDIGIVGVQIFFLLSGFLIGQILIRDFSGGVKPGTVTVFWKRRWFRTLPMYYLVLILKMAISGNPYGWKIIAYFFFLQANFVGIGFLVVSWSLVIEEWFYIFLPLALLLFFKKRIQPAKFLLFLFSFILLFFSIRFFWNYLHKGLIIYQFDCLLIGVLLAFIKIQYNPIYKKLNSFFLFAAGVTGIILLSILAGNWVSVPVFSPFYRVVWFFIISLCIASTFPFVEQSNFINTTLQKIKPVFLFFTWTSILSYSLYLIHYEFYSSSLFESYHIIMQMVILYLTCFITYFLYERPMLGLREDFSFRNYFNKLRSFSFRLLLNPQEL